MRIFDIAKRALIANIIFIGGCAHDAQSSVELFPAPLKDEDYVSSFLEATREEKVFKYFSTQYFIYVTYFSPEFTKALGKRVKELLGDEQDFFFHSSAKSGFFVSIFAPDKDKMDLNDSNLWGIKIETKNGSLHVSHIESIKDKYKWKAYFPYINTWSKEYFILFDQASYTPSAKNLLENMPLILNFSTSDAKVTFKW